MVQWGHNFVHTMAKGCGMSKIVSWLIVIFMYIYGSMVYEFKSHLWNAPQELLIIKNKQ